MMNYAIILAGIGLLLLSFANLFAFEKLRWNINLVRTEVFFQQVFKVHAFYVVLTMLGMAAVCLFATDELLAGETMMARGFSWFEAIFWGSRVLLHLFYYEKTLTRAHPVWNVFFLGAFVYFTSVFTLTIN